MVFCNNLMVMFNVVEVCVWMGVLWFVNFLSEIVLGMGFVEWLFFVFYVLIDEGFENCL